MKKLSVIMISILTYQSLQQGQNNEICQLNKKQQEVLMNQITCFNTENPLFIQDPKQTQTAIAHGLEHRCVLNEDNLIFCKGLNDHSQLSFNFDHLMQFDQIAAGYYHTCGVPLNQRIRDGPGEYSLAIYCWGDNSFGQTDVVVNGDNERVINVITGPNTTCIITATSKELKCFGKIQIGFNSYGENKVNTLKIGMNGVICAIFQAYANEKFEKKLDCWGDVLNDTNLMLFYVPEKAKANNLDVSIGFNHICTIQYNKEMIKTLKCWGSDAQGQVSIPYISQFQVSEVAAVKYTTCVIQLNSQLNCYGKPTTIPDSIKHYSRIISTGGTNTCAQVGGQMKCIGDDKFNQLTIPDGLKYSSVDFKVGFEFICGTTLSSELNCWGINVLGQTEVPPIIQKRVVKISTGLTHSCAIFRSVNDTVDTDEINSILSIECWGGHNEQGQKDVSVFNVDYSQVKFVAVGDEHTCVQVLYNNSPSTNKIRQLKCIGSNKLGQTDVKLIQEQMVVQNIAAGDFHNCATMVSIDPFVKSLSCWGYDNYGQTQIPRNFTNGMTKFSNVTAGTSFTCMIGQNIHLDQVPICWGFHLNFQFKRTNTKLISAGFNTVCLIYENGEMNCIGDNDQGHCDVEQILLGIT